MNGSDNKSSSSSIPPLGGGGASVLIKNGRIITADADYTADIFIEGENLEVLNEVLVDLLRLNLSLLGFAGNVANGVHDLRPPAVAQRHRQVEPVQVGGFLLGRPHPAEGGGRERFRPPDRPKTHALLDQFVPLGRQVMFQQSHQRVDLSGRAIPVLLREGVNREGVNAEVQAQGDRVPEAVDALTVSGDPRQAPHLGPTAVPVHDDGQVFRQ